MRPAADYNWHYASAVAGRTLETDSKFLFCLSEDCGKKGEKKRERERERNAEDNNQLSRKKPIPAETRNRNGSFRLRQFYPVDGTDASPPNVPQLHLQHQT